MASVSFGVASSVSVGVASVLLGVLSVLLGVLVGVLGAWGIGGGGGARLLNRCRRSSRSLSMLSSRRRGVVVGVDVVGGELESIRGGRCLGEVGIRAGGKGS